MTVMTHSQSNDEDNKDNKGVSNDDHKKVRSKMMIDTERISDWDERNFHDKCEYDYDVMNRIILPVYVYY